MLWSKWSRNWTGETPVPLTKPRTTEFFRNLERAPVFA
jgi:hypothetical protein